MPHVRGPRPMPHDPLDPDQPTDPAPAVRLSPTCPNCGRTPAVVFPALCAGENGKDAPLVCLACCPKGDEEE